MTTLPERLIDLEIPESPNWPPEEVEPGGGAVTEPFIGFGVGIGGCCATAQETMQITTQVTTQETTQETTGLEVRRNRRQRSI
jgi:hypothetical protein